MIDLIDLLGDRGKGERISWVRSFVEDFLVSMRHVDDSVCGVEICCFPHPPTLRVSDSALLLNDGAWGYMDCVNYVDWTGWMGDG